MKKLYLCCLLIFILHNPAKAEDTEYQDKLPVKKIPSLQDKLPVKEISYQEKIPVKEISSSDIIPPVNPRPKETWGITPVIIPAYTPETRMAISGGVVYYNYPHPESAKPNQVTVYGYYTQNQQACAGLRAERYLFTDTIKYNLNLAYTYYPNEFWGIGMDTSDDKSERYTNKSVLGNGSILYKVFTNTYFGLNMLMYHSNITRRKKNGILETTHPAGMRGTDELGSGLHLCFDSRDMVFFPHSGMLLDIKNINFAKALGSDHNFSKIDINGSHYLQIKGEHVIAFQYIIDLAWGGVPVQLLNYNNIRGYNYSRYIDKNYIGSNVEYRFPIIWRIGGTVFAGAGEIAPRIGDFNFTNIKPAAGLGLRAMVDKDEHINVRFDAGFSAINRCEFYLNIIEAF